VVLRSLVRLQAGRSAIWALRPGATSFAAMQAVQS